MEEDMGHRRVQRTGRGSYIVSLPKSWVNKVGLEKGSEIAFKAQEDSSMVLVPRKLTESKTSNEEPYVKEYFIHVDEKDDARSISRRIIALYVVSSDLIHVRFKTSDVAGEHRRAVKELVKNKLLGSEVIHERDNEILIKTLVKHHQFPVEQAIRRMAILALSAIDDAISAWRSMDEELIHDVINACDDVNRLNLYVVRQLKFSLEQSLYEELGFRTPKECLGYRIVANSIESIADNALNIARNVTVFKRMIENETLFLKETIDEEAYAQIRDFNSSAHRLFEDSLMAMFKRDYEHADRIISEAESLALRESDLATVISSKRLDPNVSSTFSLVLDSTRRIIEFGRDIAEVTLNRTIEEVSANQPVERLTET